MCFTIRGVLHKRYLPRPLDLLCYFIIHSHTFSRRRTRNFGVVAWFHHLAWSSLQLHYRDGERYIEKSDKEYHGNTLCLLKNHLPLSDELCPRDLVLPVWLCGSSVGNRFILGNITSFQLGYRSLKSFIDRRGGARR